MRALHITRLPSFCFLFLMLGSPGRIWAQGPAVRGRVSDADTRGALSAATVVLTCDSLPPTGVLTAPDGTFRLNAPANGLFRLRIMFVGYSAFDTTLFLANQDIVLPNVRLVATGATTDTVRIEGFITPMVVRGDTVQFNAGAFQTQPDATTEDLVRRMPGITTENGAVTAQGEQVQRVLVDGQPVFDNDPMAALRNLPAEMVQSVQVYDDAGDAARVGRMADGQTQRTINIVTRPERRNFVMGRAYGGHDFRDLYDAGAAVNRMKGANRITFILQSNNINRQGFGFEDILGPMGPGARGGGGGNTGSGMGGQGGGQTSNMGQGGPGAGGMAQSPGGGGGAGMFLPPAGIVQSYAAGLNWNQRWGNLRFSGGYFFTRTVADAISNTVTSYLQATESDSTTVLRSDAASLTATNTHRVYTRAEWDLDSLNSLIISLRGNFQARNLNSLQTALTEITGLEVNSSRNTLISNIMGYRGVGSVFYRHRFGPTGRFFTVNASTTQVNRSGTDDNRALNRYWADSLYFHANLDQLSGRVTANRSYTGEVSYTEPLARGTQLEVSYSYTHSDETAEQLVRENNPAEVGFGGLLPGISSDLKANSQAHRPGIGITTTQGKHLLTLKGTYGYTLLRASQQFPMGSSVNRTFQNILPSLVYQYSISQTHNLRFIYRGQNTLPSASQLQEAVDLANPLRPSSGNKLLSQSYQHFIFLRYAASRPANSRLFSLNVVGGYTLNHITNTTQILPEAFPMESGVVLQPGAQFTRPQNLDGHVFVRAFATFSKPFFKNKLNLSANALANFTRTPSQINSQPFFTENTSVGVQCLATSNISPKIDFSLSSRPLYTWVQSTLGSIPKSEFLNLQNRLTFTFRIIKGLYVQGEMDQTLNTGLVFGRAANFTLLNLSAGYKFLHKENGDLRFTTFDVLNQNRSISRSVAETFIEDNRTGVVTQYFMLTFTYTFRKFMAGSLAPDANNPAAPPNRPDAGPPMLPGGFPGGPPPR